MGTYLNPGNMSYQMAINSEIFIDKTEMLRYLNAVVNTQQRFVSVSRPRRFGKTIAADMICAYYDGSADSHKMFEELEISKNSVDRPDFRGIKWDQYLGQFDVVRLVMTDFMEDSDTVSDMLDYLMEEVIDELKKVYPQVEYGKRNNLRNIFERIYRVTERQFVIVIDEWDAVFRVWKDDERGHTEYLEFLRDWLKDKTYMSLVYMTGILPIKKYGEHSALNMFTEYSMTSPKSLARYAGFTSAEVRMICDERNLNFESMKLWYDGYRLSERPTYSLVKDMKDTPEDGVYEIYSPLSVVNAARYKRIENYWNKSETYEALAEYIRKDYDGLKDAVALLMDGGRVNIDISSYQNDMTTFNGRDDILSLLIHLGYLGFDDERSEVFIPNREILDEFRTSTKSTEWVSTFESFERSQRLLKATWDCDEREVVALLEQAHDCAGNRTYNDEAALSYAIRLAYYAAQKYYTEILELDTGKGYADILYIPSPLYADKPVLLIELKYEKSAQAAIRQIHDKRYQDRLEHYKGNILLVGINYDKDNRSDSEGFKHHTCQIKRA